MKHKECINPSDNLTIVVQDYEAKACGNCVIPQILRKPCQHYQVTARLRAAINYGMDIKPNPKYPDSSDYPTIAICQGNRAIAISTK